MGRNVDLRRAISAPGSLQEVTCRCGSSDFKQEPRAKLSFDRLNPSAGPVVVSGVVFFCASCSAPLRFTERIEEIRNGEGPTGPHLEVAP